MCSGDHWKLFFVSNPLAPRALLPYWVPMLMLPLLWKSMTSKLGSSAMISLPVTVAFSHAIFLLPLALVLTARYFPDQMVLGWVAIFLKMWQNLL